MSEPRVGGGGPWLPCLVLVDDAEVFGTALPRVRSHQWPPGRGYLVSGAALEIVQVALAP